MLSSEMRVRKYKWYQGDTMLQMKNVTSPMAWSDASLTPVLKRLEVNCMSSLVFALNVI